MGLSLTVGVFLAVCMGFIWTCLGHTGFTWYVDKWGALRPRRADLLLLALRERPAAAARGVLV